MPHVCIWPLIAVYSNLSFLSDFFSRDSYLRNVWQGRKSGINKPVLLSSLLMPQAITFLFSSSLWVSDEVFLDFYVQCRYPWYGNVAEIEVQAGTSLMTLIDNSFASW